MKKLCSFGCDKETSAHGWCEKHYKRWLIHGDPTKTLQTDCKGKTCIDEGCTKPARKRLLCNSHYTKLWRTEKPELAHKNMAQSWFTRAVRRKNAPGYHSRMDWEELRKTYDGKCAYCKVAPSTDRDHVVPLSKGGTNDISNILPACKSCNCRKSNKSLEQWQLIGEQL